MCISKKKSRFVLILIFTFQLCWVSAVQAGKSGDLNGDNKVNISDLVLLINHILNPPNDRFIKLDNVGGSLYSVATKWSCVKDNVSGLIWEVKTNDDGLRDQDWEYTWFNSTGINDGGDPGISNGGRCFDSMHCDTEKFVQQVNSQGLCGYNDWRMPTRGELKGIVSDGHEDPMIDVHYFPKTNSSYFWSASPYAHGSDSAWLVFFDSGYSGYSNKQSSLYVRLVREGQ
jgi:hypothetical protein